MGNGSEQLKSMSRNARRTNRLIEENVRVDQMGTNVYSSKDNSSLHKQLNGQFLLYQIVFQRLLNDNEQLPDESQEGLAKYLNPQKPIDEQIMRQFANESHQSKCIHWYTRETSIHRISNKAFRTQNIGDVTAFRQFIGDLHQQLKEQNKEIIC